MNWRENKDEKVKIANRDKPFEWFCKELGMISVDFQGKPFNITVIQVYALTSNTKEAELEQFCEDL